MDDQWVALQGPSFGRVRGRIVWRDGAAGDSASHGASVLAGELLLRGTRHRTRAQLEEDLDALHLHVFVNVHRWTTTVGFRVPEANLQEGLRLLEEMLCSPAMDDDELADVRALTDLDLRVEGATTEGLLHHLLPRAMYGTGAGGRPLAGRSRLRGALTRDLLLQRLERCRSTPAVIGWASDDPSRHAAALRAFWSSLRSRTPLLRKGITPCSGPMLSTHRAAKAAEGTQSSVALLLPAPGAQHPQRAEVALVHRLFSDGFISPLVDTLRTRLQLSYSVRGTWFMTQDKGAFCWELEPEPDRVEEALVAAQHAWDAFREGTWTPSFFERGRRAALAQRETSLGTITARLDAAVYHAWRGWPANNLALERERWEQLREDDARALARTLASPSALRAVLVDPPGTPQRDHLAEENVSSTRRKPWH